ncbi:MAG: SpoVA/SpoVAEb family sporulation membrane protein [Ruminococcus sp.]|nr:SpoVA/SpoVAEb family sporulation membrane protein [Ruminococcus sp.]
MTDIIKAFLVGGAFCAIGQLLIDKTRLTPARILTGYVVAGVFLSAAGIYEPVADFAGAGATVPLTGFGHLLAEGVRDAVDSDGVKGILTGGLVAAAGGISAALICGLSSALLFRQKDKN